MVEARGRLQLKIEGVELKDLDFFSKSDPICVLEEKVGNVWQKRGQTEVIMDDLNPVFETVLEFDYSSGEQLMRFWMYDWDGSNDFDDIGMVEISVSELLSVLDSEEPIQKPLKLPKQPNSKRGDIKVYVRSSAADQDSHQI